MIPLTNWPTLSFIYGEQWIIMLFTSGQVFWLCSLPASCVCLVTGGVWETGSPLLSASLAAAKVTFKVQIISSQEMTFLNSCSLFNGPVLNGIRNAFGKKKKVSVKSCVCQERVLGQFVAPLQRPGHPMNDLPTPSRCHIEVQQNDSSGPGGWSLRASSCSAVNTFMPPVVAGHGFMLSSPSLGTKACQSYFFNMLNP